jgi:hypothetical protein
MTVFVKKAGQARIPNSFDLPNVTALKIAAEARRSLGRTRLEKLAESVGGSQTPVKQPVKGMGPAALCCFGGILTAYQLSQMQNVPQNALLLIQNFQYWRTLGADDENWRHNSAFQVKQALLAMDFPPRVANFVYLQMFTHSPTAFNLKREVSEE